MEIDKKSFKNKINFLFTAVQIGGEFVSIQIGVSMSQVLDPATGSSTQVLSQLFFQGFHRLADGRLGNKQRLGGVGKA